MSLVAIKAIQKGITSTYTASPPDATQNAYMAANGLTAFRCINNENGCTCNADGTGFSKAGTFLDDDIALNKAIPGVTRVSSVIGGFLPTALRVTEAGGAWTSGFYRCVSAAAWKTYVKGMLDFIYLTQGLNDIWFIFGNEFHAIADPWIDATAATDRDAGATGTPDGGAQRYTNYLTWYGHTSDAFKEWKITNPSKLIKLGGPAMDYHLETLPQFYTDCQSATHILDFVDVHFNVPQSFIAGKSLADLMGTVIKDLRAVAPSMPVWITENTFTIGGSSGTFGNNPITTVSGSNIITLNKTAHGLVANQRLVLYNAIDTNGITAANINGHRTVLDVTDANNYRVVVGANATSNGTGGGTTPMSYALDDQFLEWHPTYMGAAYLERALFVARQGYTEGYHLLGYENRVASQANPVRAWFFVDSYNNWEPFHTWLAHMTLQQVTGTYVQAGVLPKTAGVNSVPMGIVANNGGLYNAAIWNFSHQHNPDPHNKPWSDATKVQAVLADGSRKSISRYKLNGSSSWIIGEPTLNYGDYCYCELV